jgi:transcription initiation factor TFIIF subunit alpha
MQYNLNQKRDPQQWLAARKGKAPSAATVAMFKAEAEGKDVIIGSSLVMNSGQSLGPGGRRLKTVDSGMDHLFGEDDNEEGVRRRKERELGEEGDMDEQVYEEDFADDDEHAEADDNDEEAKEAEVRHWIILQFFANFLLWY